MPNYVLNSFMKVSQPNRLKSLIKNDKGDIDFNVICPMPEDLNTTDGDASLISKDYYQYVNRAKDLKEYISLINKELSLNIPLVTDGMQLFEMNLPKQEEQRAKSVYTTWNYLKYGEVGWYDWRKKNWGCKWNACDCSEWEFQTPWCTPYQWLEKLAKKCDFILLFADEDIGSNCGVYVAKDGELEEYYNDICTNESTVFACTLQGYDLKEYAEGFDEEKTREEFREMYENREELLRNFFVNLGCEYVYDEIGKDLKSCV